MTPGEHITIEGTRYEVIGSAVEASGHTETILRGPHGYMTVDLGTSAPVAKRTHGPFRRGDLAAYSKPDSRHNGHTVTVLGPAPYWPGEPEPRWNIRCPGTPSGGHTHDVEWITDEKYLTLLEDPVPIEPARLLTITIPLPEDEIVALYDVQWLMEMLAEHHETAKAGVIHRNRS